MPDTSLPALSPDELLRYARHLTLSEIGVDPGQPMVSPVHNIIPG